MLVSLTVGKVDAGVAVLLTQDNRLVSSIQTPLCLAVSPYSHLQRFMLHLSMRRLNAFKTFALIITLFRLHAIAL